MERPPDNEIERQDLSILVKQIKSDSGCVLVLGPRIAVRTKDPNRQPLDEILAAELLASLRQLSGDTSATLGRAAELHYRENGNRSRLELKVQEFYGREKTETTDFHRHLAELPFRLCISASPDSLMLNAFELVENKRPQKDYYRFKGPRQQKKSKLTAPTVDRPLVYYLFGHHDDPESLVLTDADLIDFLVTIITGDPPIPDEVRSILKDKSVSFLFLGFGFQNWYLRVLLKVLDVYGHRDNAMALEDPQFFDLPESRHTIAFFSGDRRIDFRHLRWEPFAKQLLETYNEGLQQEAAEPPAGAPVAFISYASEDREDVEALAEELAAKGVEIWQDKQKLRAGDNWSRVLQKVIRKDVNYVIFVESLATKRAISGVFNWEIEAARLKQAEMGEFEGQKLRFLIPVSLGAGAPASSLEDLHSVDVSTPQGVVQLAQSILEDWGNRAKLEAREIA